MTVGGPGTDDTARPRCAWAGETSIYVRYHDDEWGLPLHGEAALFERISLEAFQSGLSWLTILRKRPAFRAAFAGFDIDSVAAFDDTDVQRLLLDAGIVRNRAKIVTTIANARAVRGNIDDLDAMLWSFAPTDHVRPASAAEMRATSVESIALAKQLRHHGVRFVGPITAYALMQATGIVDDHVVGCWRAGGNQQLPPR